ncbi:Predicted membrane protein [Saccharopolyspora antimicrobica]|uniref:Membrane protein DUF2306 n=1 Tax=Saccharopolyspora antimicrobica TaxID=455193 RepID=A0A1I4R8I8_9PSEU|nr:DUF2306 domain-containing protein [Saccharopolyspora antimicrobica]RKT88128.1 putative membrane protein DUF2306 [Saccharopolyspora antimicrobica]SFM48316.1 Predicted membrane protein [Saccharopolyspora antimicrobica]
MSTVVQRPEVERPPVRWWRRPWVGPLALVAVMFVVYSLPPYLSLDPALSRVPVSEGMEVHYPLLVGHVLFGTVAILSCCFQVWPAFRARYPRAHRLIGRAYVFAGVLPAAVLAVAVAVFAPFGPVAVASNLTLATVWFGCTVAGWRAGRARRFGDHRKWMLRSFVLTISTMTNRVWSPLWAILLAPQLPTTYGGNMTYFISTIAGLSTWLGWVVPLLVCQWWLDRRPRRARGATR